MSKLIPPILTAALVMVNCHQATAGYTFADSRFQASVFASSIPAPRKVLFAPGRDFGSDLFVVSNESGGQNTGYVFVIAGNGGMSTWAGTLNGPYGMAFSTGGSYGSYLYVACEDPTDGLYRVDPTARTISANLVSIDEATGLVFSTGGAFGDFLYATQSRGADQDNHVYRVTDSMGSSDFANLGKNAHTNDLLLSSGGAFGTYLYAVGQLPHEDETTATDLFIRRIDTAGNVSTLSQSGLGPYRGFMALGPGGTWGDELYVTAGPSIYKVDSAGAVSLFATGFSSLGGLAFSPDGAALYVAQGGPENNVLAIVPEPSSAAPLLTGLAWLFRRRARTKRPPISRIS